MQTTATVRGMSYQRFYWPTVVSRGEFVRPAPELAGAAHTDVAWSVRRLCASPPAGTMSFTCGWCVSIEPDVRSSSVAPT